MRYLAAVLGIFGLEIIIKEKIEEFEEKKELKKCGGFLLIRKYHNKGAFLNAGQKWPNLVKGISIFLSVILTICFIVTLTHAGSKTLKWGLALLLGGAYSNTYDRMKREYVIDYVSFNVPWKGLRGVVFNIGDFCIIIGALLCILKK